MAPSLRMLVLALSLLWYFSTVSKLHPHYHHHCRHLVGMVCRQSLVLEELGLPIVLFQVT